MGISHPLPYFAGCSGLIYTYRLLRGWERGVKEAEMLPHFSMKDMELVQEDLKVEVESEVERESFPTE